MNSKYFIFLNKACTVHKKGITQTLIRSHIPEVATEHINQLYFHSHQKAVNLAGWVSGMLFRW